MKRTMKTVELGAAVWAMTVFVTAALLMSAGGARAEEPAKVDLSAAAASTSIPARSPAEETPDPTVVRQKIQALSVRDDSLPQKEQPRQWLWDRKAQVVSELIAGLEYKDPAVAKACLEILDRVKLPESERKALVDALVRIAGDQASDLHAPATLSLCHFADEPRAAKVLEAAVADAASFPDPQNRATIAEALGRKAQATALLVPLLQVPPYTEYDYKLAELVTRIGELGDPSAIAPLDKLAAESAHWSVIAAARLSLSRIDPRGHTLTADQQTFLKDSGWRGKITMEGLQKKWRELANLKRDEVRPLVLRMLRTQSNSDEALYILQLWHDTAALPEVRAILEALPNNEVPFKRQNFLAACFSLDDTDQTAKDIVAMIGGNHDDEFFNLPVVRGVASALAPNERKLATLRLIRDKAKGSLVPQSLFSLEGDSAPLLTPLMSEETNLLALGTYAEVAARDPQKRFGELLRGALGKIDPREVVGYAGITSARKILDACAFYNLADCGKLADRLLAAPESPVRSAAARLSAKFGGDRPKALAVLFQELQSDNKDNRRVAADCLADVPCLDEAERRSREAALLEHVGKPTEDAALRVLSTCAGPLTVERFAPLLEGPDVSRAVYAAWVLAQGPKGPAQEKALRRLAVYAMFHHQVYQQGEGIDFTVAPNRWFHQGTGGRSGPETSPVRIPDAWLVPFKLDADEQLFAVRAYRHLDCCSVGMACHVMSGPWRMYSRGVGPGWDASHLPLLRAIAAEDPYVELFHVQGRLVAHFKYRKAAAEVVATLTGQKATYTGLGGEQIDSADVPREPYQNQDVLVARFKLDRIEALLARPESADSKARLTDCINEVQNLIQRERGYEQEQFGEGLRTALLAEADRRKITDKLAKEGFWMFRKIP